MGVLYDIINVIKNKKGPNDMGNICRSGGLKLGRKGSGKKNVKKK